MGPEIAVVEKGKERKIKRIVNAPEEKYDPNRHDIGKIRDIRRRDEEFGDYHPPQE